MTRKLSRGTWEQVQQLTRELYQVRGLKLSQVTAQLQGQGFDVDERLMRRKIAEWGLQKKFCEQDVRHQSQPETTSLYPFPWTQAYNGTGRESIIQVRSGPPIEASAGISSTWMVEAQFVESDGDVASTVNLEPQYGGSESTNEFKPGLIFNTGTLIPYSPDDPDGHRLMIYGLRHAQLICDQYVALRPPYVGTEPTVHADTLHGRFGDRVQHGLSRLVRQDKTGASASLDEACGLIQKFLFEADPVCLALVLVTLCEVSVQGFRDVIELILKRAIESVCTNEHASESLRCLLHVLWTFPDVTHCAIQMLRVMANVQFTDKSLKWRNLYIRERLCDGLYFCGDQGSSASMRLDLLSDQGRFYGRNRRNVLYTLTNVADNYLRSGQLDRAEKGFAAAHRRAQSLTGYGKAKIQFAALEGLAATQHAEAYNALHYGGRGGRSLSERTKQARCSLQRALEFAQSAETTAVEWFEPCSRRTVRIQEAQHSMIKELQELEDEV